MGRIVFFLLVALVVYLALRAMQSQRHTRRTPPPRSATSNDGVQQMVRCEHCGLNVPQSDALVSSDNSQWYCCEEHRNAAGDKH